MGRNTSDVIKGFGSWPYGDKPTWICTKSGIDVIEGCNLQKGKIPVDVRKEAKNQGIKHLWLVGGGTLASSFLEENLLTHLSISQMPVILGGGIKLFGGLQSPIEIRSISAKPQKSGFLQLEFAVTPA